MSFSCVLLRRRPTVPSFSFGQDDDRSWFDAPGMYVERRPVRGSVVFDNGRAGHTEADAFKDRRVGSVWAADGEVRMLRAGNSCAAGELFSPLFKFFRHGLDLEREH
jgi:hypothetical protein